MPSPLYQSVVDVVSTYIGPEKAIDCINRQVAHCNATADNFSKDHFRQILQRVVGATSMWIRDKAKRAELSSRLESLA